MNTQTILAEAARHLEALSGHVFDVLTLTKPSSPDAAMNLARIISKLSPLLGNLIEFNTVEFLNTHSSYQDFGTWKRQDPGFPDAVFAGTISPTPGFEIKAWFPLATEITARFKDSQTRFAQDQTYVCLLAWLPEYLIFGKPHIVDVCIVSGLSIAQARDNHYHRPPDYLVLEPEDTSHRTLNLQQSTTSGYKWQGTSHQFIEAEKIVAGWGKGMQHYQASPDYQALLRQLMARFPYRLDTNFAKLDRIFHTDIEQFKARVMARELQGLALRDWRRVFSYASEDSLRQTFAERLGIGHLRDQDGDPFLR